MNDCTTSWQDKNKQCWSNEDALLLFKNTTALFQNTKTWRHVCLSDCLSDCFCHCEPWQGKRSEPFECFFSPTLLNACSSDYFWTTVISCPSNRNRLNDGMAACLSTRTAITVQAWSPHAEMPSSKKRRVSESSGSHSSDEPERKAALLLVVLKGAPRVE